MIAELCHQNLRVLYGMYDGKTQKRKVALKKKKLWESAMVKNRKKAFHLKGVPNNMVYFECDMIKRGIPLLKEKGAFVQQLITQGIGSAARFFMTGDPSNLLKTIKDGLTYAAKKGIEAHTGVPFQVGYWIDGFKTWCIFNKLKISDLKLKSILNDTENQEENETEFQNESEIFEQIKNGLKRFEKEV